MKTNNNIVGGKLKTASYADYAHAPAQFLHHRRRQHRPSSPINEPNITVSYESMRTRHTEVAPAL